jgi:hypothetical protein
MGLDLDLVEVRKSLPNISIHYNPPKLIPGFYAWAGVYLPWRLRCRSGY